MVTLQEAQKKVREMNKILKPILKTLGVNLKTETDENQILGLHESATKLWIATMGKKGQDEIDRRVASALIGVMVLAEHFKVKNLEEAYLKRIQEVIDGNNKASVEMKKFKK